MPRVTALCLVTVITLFTGGPVAAQLFPQQNWNPGVSWDTGRPFDQHGLGIQNPQASEAPRAALANNGCPAGTREWSGVGDCTTPRGRRYAYRAPVGQSAARPPTAPLIHVVPPAPPPVQAMTANQVSVLRARIGGR